MAAGYEKDATYYLADGNVTILVSTTLFKVHRSVLARDGSIFEDMFDLDNCATTNSESDSRVREKEGKTDEDPIHLQGDTADEFRDLLWSLYALPSEIVAAMSIEGDLLQLSNVARMAHKYHYITTEGWALSALLACFSSQPVASVLTQPLTKITEVAILCEDKPLLNAVRLRWKGLLREKKDLAVAINVMGRLGICDLEGLAYHGMLLEGRERWESDPNLTRDHRIRLLSGYHNLTKASEALTHTPPEFTHQPKCTNTGKCSAAWAVLWESITNPNPDIGMGSQALVHDKLDLTGRMMMAVSVMKAFCERRLPQWPLIRFSESACCDVALQATMRVSKETQEGMMNFFQDVV